MKTRKVLVKKVLSSLNKHNVGYCVLRNYGFLLRDSKKVLSSEKSVDMAIAEKDLMKFHKVVISMGFKRRKPSFSLKHISYFKILELEIVSFDVQVGGVHWNDICYLGEEFVIGNRIKKSFFYVPSDNDMFVMLLLHSILGKRRFKPEYRSILSKLGIQPDYVAARIKAIFGARLAKKMVRLAGSKRFDELLRMKYYLIPYFIFRSFKNSVIFARLFLRWLRWKRFFVPYPFIAIMGPDGSGKTTAVAGLDKVVKNCDRKSIIVYSGRGKHNVLPINKLGKNYKKRELESEKAGAPKKSLKKTALYTFSSFFYALDLMLRYISVLPKRLNGHIVISDRYCSDIFLMENVPFFVRKGLLMLFARPDLTFYLYNSVEVLHERRGHDIENLRWQMKNFGLLRKRFDSVDIITINKKQTLEDLGNITLEWLLHNWY